MSYGLWTVIVCTFILCNTYDNTTNAEVKFLGEKSCLNPYHRTFQVHSGLR